MPNAQPTEDNEACQLKAGHPPAVKVGNMRIVQRTHNSSSTSEEDKKGDSDEAVVPTACSFAPKTVIKSGGPAELSTIQQNVPDAVKHSHDKPEIKHDYRTTNTKPNMHIQQPRK